MKQKALHDVFTGVLNYCSGRRNQTISIAISRLCRPRRNSFARNHLSPGEAMSNPKEQVRIKLTPDQKAEVKASTSKDGEAIELTAAELEERIAPMHF